MRTRAVALGVLAVGCGGNSPDEPSAVDVRVAYVLRLPTGCPDQANPCYAMCAHHNAPAGLQAIVPLWGAEAVRLGGESTGRYEGVLPMVPTNTTLRLYGRDIGVCCVDACAYPPPVLDDILLNGTRLTTVVRDGLPEGVTAALEFTVTGNGAIRQ